jgi:23S rRNA (cytidine2498-2'-O)-methyltransferase
MSSVTPQYVFMTCRPGAERALKCEVARKQPAWRFAFSRPGFVTFKLDAEARLGARELAERRWTFAHSHGVSLGRLTGDRLSELVEQVWQHPGVVELATGELRVADIHVWQRDNAEGTDATADDDAPTSYGTPLAAEIERALRETAPNSFAMLKKEPGRGRTPRRHPSPRGGLVLDVFVLEPGEWWIGYHVALSPTERWPGGQLPVSLPQHAVSRAYAKIDEAIRWSGLPIAAGDECVEIGCAPGGASQALVDRGLFVTGIDPADVDPAVLSHPRFRHLKKRGKDVRRQEFTGVRWLVADMNIAPQATLDEVEPIVTHPGITIRGLVLTLKLPDWNLAEYLDEFAARVHGWGYRDVRMRQLTTGGQEVCLVALRRKALRRLGRKHKSKRAHRRGEPASAGRKRGDQPHSGPPAPHF